MACNTLNGVSKGCKTGVGGTYTFYLAQKDDVLSVSGATEGLIDNVTMSAGTYFHEYRPAKFSSSWSDNPAPAANNTGTFYTPTVNMVFSKNQASLRNEVKILGQSELVCIVKNTDGKYFYLAETNGLELVASTYTSGVAIGDANAWTIVLAGGEPEPAKEVDEDVIAGLLE